MKHVYWLILWMACSFTMQAQYVLTGMVTDIQEKIPVIGATVTLLEVQKGVVTDKNGAFELTDIEAGFYTLEVSMLGYHLLIDLVDINSDKVLAIGLVPSEILLDDVLVKSTRATDNTATSYTTIDKTNIDKVNLGQDVPFLLDQTPSVVVTSDAGAGIGYTGIRIRGSDATRVNVTINGIPFNDSESQGTYWVDLPDFASSVENIQIQRGVGTSTNGAGAFGGSVNIQTTGLQPKAYGEINTSLGSFNTLKNNVQFGSGLINSKFAIDGRLSRITSDGYIDRASSDLQSYFLSAAFYGKNSIVRANVFAGKEVTYQSWGGVPEAYLDIDSLRTYNEYTYDNQVDDYLQNHYQLHYAQAITPAMNFSTAVHYTKGKGFYEQYKEGQSLSDYGFENTTAYNQYITETDTIYSLIEETDLIRRKWLDNDFYGFTYGLNYGKDKLNTSLGGAWNKYIGGHFGEVIWSDFAGDGTIRDRYYDNTGTKIDWNIFWKTDYRFANSLLAFVDLQYRTIDYGIAGVDEDKGEVALNFDYNFFNPKIGLSYVLSPRQRLYASFSMANREPTRSNLVDNDTTPTPETLYDWELGYRFRNAKHTFSTNYYLMQYKNQLVLTGNLNDVGNPIQQNVADSYRTGIEAVGDFNFSSKINWQANATFSVNKINTFNLNTVVFDDYWNVLGDTSIVYTDTDIAFSPNVIVASNFTYKPLKGTEIGLISKYVGTQFLDNTSNENRQIGAYFVNNLRLSYTIKTSVFDAIVLDFMLNNVLDARYASNGWTYFLLFDSAEGAVSENYNHYYPQAGRNYLAAIKLRF